MKNRYQIYIIVVCIIMFGVVGSFSVKADSVKNSENDFQSILAELETVTKDMPEITAETPNDDIIKTGKYYFYQKYLNECNIVYLEKYIEYLQSQIIACEQMYQMGETTETVFKSYQAQKALAEAELTIARNECGYNDFYLKKHQLEYEVSNIKEIKDIESIRYYIEKYPNTDDMTILRYMTDYNNAIANMEAKKIEISALETDVKMAALLLQEGEISQIEYMEKEVSLAKAEYELEQCYIEMNVACWQLMMLEE